MKGTGKMKKEMGDARREGDRSRQKCRDFAVAEKERERERERRQMTNGNRQEERRE